MSVLQTNFWIGCLVPSPPFVVRETGSEAFWVHCQFPTVHAVSNWHGSRRKRRGRTSEGWGHGAVIKLLVGSLWQNKLCMSMCTVCEVGLPYVQICCACLHNLAIALGIYIHQFCFKGHVLKKMAIQGSQQVTNVFQCFNCAPPQKPV